MIEEGRMTDESLKQLLDDCLTLNESAWEQLFRNLYGLITTQVMRVGLKNEDVEDAVMETYASIIQNPDEFHAARSPLAYVAAAGRYTALRMKKKADRRDRRTEALDDPAGSPFTPEPLRDRPRQKETMLANQIISQLLHSFADLRPLEQDLLRSKYHDDLTYDEIAYITGKSNASLRVATRRALEAWRTKAQQQLQEDLNGARLEEVLAHLPPRDYTPADQALWQQMRRLIEEPRTLPDHEKQALEHLLEQDAHARRIRVLADRQAEEDNDVRGHQDASVGPIPGSMLERLMEQVRAQRAM